MRTIWDMDPLTDQEIEKQRAATSRDACSRNFRGLVPRDFFDFVNSASVAGYISAASSLNLSPLRARFFLRTLKTHISPVLFDEIVEMTDDRVGWLRGLEEEIDRVYEYGISETERSYASFLAESHPERFARVVRAPAPPALRNPAPGHATRLYTTVSAFAALCDLVGADHVRSRIARAGVVDYRLGWNRNLRIYLVHTGIAVSLDGAVVTVVPQPETIDAWANAAVDVLFGLAVGDYDAKLTHEVVSRSLKKAGILPKSNPEGAVDMCVKILRSVLEFGPLP